MDNKTLIKYAKKVKKIVTIEENVLSGGFGSLILEVLNEFSPQDTYKIRKIGLKDKFIENYGTQDDLFKINNLTVNQIIKKLIS